MADLVLKNAKMVTPFGVREGGIAIENEKIVAIGTDNSLPSAPEVIDCRGMVMLPGVFDPHVHLGGRTPYEENIVTETTSAAAGGVTSFLQYLRSADPEYSVVKERIDFASKLSLIDTSFHFIVSGLGQAKDIENFSKKFEIATFKFYMGGYSEGNPIGIVTADDGVLYAGMERIRNLGPYNFCMVHAEDNALVEMFTEEVKRSGRNDLQAYTDSRPDFVEEQDILRAIWMAELLGCPLYIPHVTIGAAIDAALAANHRGARIILETCPHYLGLTTDHPAFEGDRAGIGKVSPPLRDKVNQDRLWDGLAKGYISTVGSDHVPIEKSGGALWEERPGFAGMATILPVMLTEGYLKGRIGLETIAAVTALNPAKLFGYYPQKGSIEIGSDGDIVLCDLQKEQVVSPLSTHSRFTSAFEGQTLKGWPILTVRRGEVIFREGEVLALPGSGRILTRNGI
jgi:dihydroorotase-like cyclic amidohydrolase